jgi:hypothetical protein
MSYSVEITEENQEDVYKALQEAQELECKHVEGLANELGISYGAAWDVHYLRNRSRWTQDKENKLIELAKQGVGVNICEWDG